MFDQDCSDFKAKLRHLLTFLLMKVEAFVQDVFNVCADCVNKQARWVVE